MQANPQPGDEHRFDKWIALLAAVAIAVHLALRWSPRGSELFGPFQLAEWPLIVALAGGGLPLVIELLWKALHREFGSDLLAGISIVTSIFLDEYLAGTLVVLMLSGGEAIEAYAVRSASSVLEALARRMPTQAHRKTNETIHDIPVDQVAVGDTLLVSGDRESEVRYLAELVGIHEVRCSQSPEQKLAIVPEETQRANTVFVGDGINDAPALTSASRSAAAPTLLPRPRTP